MPLLPAVLVDAFHQSNVRCSRSLSLEQLRIYCNLFEQLPKANIKRMEGCLAFVWPEISLALYRVVRGFTRPRDPYSGVPTTESRVRRTVYVRTRKNCSAMSLLMIITFDVALLLSRAVPVPGSWSGAGAGAL